MRITAARYKDGELCLTCSPEDGIRFAATFKDGDWDLRKAAAKQKRSLNANAYAWQLIDKIADKLRLSKLDVYRRAVAETPGVIAMQVCCRQEDAPKLITDWEAGHLGRQAQQWPNSDGYVDVLLISGSSDYDTKQMSIFIGLLVQDAQALGIETKDPEDIQSLLDSWEGRKNG